MKSILRSFPIPWRQLVRLGATLLSFCLLPTQSRAQTDNFDDNSDQEWTRYNPLGNAIYTTANGTYRLRCPQNTNNPAAGPARAGSLHSPRYTDFYVAVDVVSWDDNIDQAFGILARLNNPGLGTSLGYAFTYRRETGTNGGALDISRISNEAPSDVSTTGNDNFHFEPGRTYRMVFLGKGNVLEGRVYQLPELVIPVRSITGNDNMFTNGASGLVIYDPLGSLSPDATFDNYFAAGTEPPRMDITYITDFNEVLLSWPTNAGAFLLQWATNLSATPLIWTGIPETAIFRSGDRFTYSEEPFDRWKIFRLVQD